MGGSGSKNKKKSTIYEKDFKGLKEKMRLIQEQMNEIAYEKEKESSEYENEIMVFAFKEAGWKQERKKLREEVKKLRKVVEEKDERNRALEEKLLMSEKGSELKELEQLGSNNMMVEEMRKERARRDETVEKWKQLYLTIKVELDDLIQRTHKDGMYWRAEEEDIAEKLNKELQIKEETIKSLNSRLASKENELNKRDREVDILRQSLKIVCNKKALKTKKTSKNSLFGKQDTKVSCY